MIEFATLPENLHSERTVLGAMMTDAVSLNEALSHLREADFLLDSHRTIYRRMRQMASENRGVDLLTLMNELTESKQLEAVGSIGYLAHLTEGIPRNCQIGDHLRILRRKSASREVMKMAEAALQMAADEGNDPLEVLTDLSDRATAEIAGSDSKRPISIMEHSAIEFERWIECRKNPQGSMGLSYGNPLLDEYTNGMQPGEVTVIGARSGVGKTSILGQAVHANCSQGIGAEVFSLEAPGRRMLHTLWAIESGVPYGRVRRPQECNVTELQMIKSAMNRIAEWNLRIYDKSDLQISQICAYSRLGIRQHGSKFIGVDYAQIVSGPGRDDRTRVSNVSRSLTQMAKDEGVSLMLLSQLAKVPREFYAKAPTINELRETGQLENDAHIVMLMHRWYDPDTSKLSEEAEIIIPKMRDGEPGMLQANFCKRSLRFL